MKLRRRNCAHCGRLLTLTDIRAVGPFPCPTCKTLLVASEYYPLLILFLNFTIVTSIFAALGFRGSSLVRALLWAFLPVLFFCSNVFKYLIPPKVEIYMPDTTLHLR